MTKRRRRSKHTSSGPTPYEILGVGRDASFDEIRKAYLRKVREHPPERDPENFRKIRSAYGDLREGGQKRRTDLSLFRRESGLRLDGDHAPDVVQAFRARALRLVLAASDLYTDDFSDRFEDIESRIRKLR